MSNAAIENEGPTKQRLRHARGVHIDQPEVDRNKTERLAWRIVNVVESMNRAGKLCSHRWSAWSRFEADWTRAAAEGRIIAKYGARAGVGGTPANQLTAEAMDVADAGAARRSDAYDRVRGGLAALQVPRFQTALMMATTQECSLEDIGREIGRYQDRGKAIAVAASVLEDALWLLHTYYQTLHSQANKVP